MIIKLMRAWPLIRLFKSIGFILIRFLILLKKMIRMQIQTIFNDAMQSFIGGGVLDEEKKLLY